MKEIWKDILGYEGRYQASSLGKIKSLSQKRKLAGAYFETKEIILKYKISNCNYFMVSLLKKTLSVHRLIANTFISNNENKKCVNHINGIKSDNRIENLEWCSHSENLYHAYKLGIKLPNNGRKGKFGINSKNSKKIAQYDKSGNIINIFYGCYEAKRKLGYSSSNINQCCNNKRKLANGFIWKYV